MARLNFTHLLFVIITYMVFGCSHSSRRTVKLVYRPYGPNMCRELGKDSQDSFFFVLEDLSCNRIPKGNLNDAVTCEEGIQTGVSVVEKKTSNVAKILGYSLRMTLFKKRLSAWKLAEEECWKWHSGLFVIDSDDKQAEAANLANASGLEKIAFGVYKMMFIKWVTVNSTKKITFTAWAEGHRFDVGFYAVLSKRDNYKWITSNKVDGFLCNGVILCNGEIKPKVKDPLV